MPLFPDLSENIAPHRQALEFEWHQTFPKVWEYLCNIFPSMQNDISHIEIRVTNYGTKMSYQGIPSIKDRTWTCYVRYDMPMSVAYEGLIQGILHAEQYKTLMTWEGRETIADFLINQLQLLGYFKEFKPTINALLTLDPALLIESHQYLQQLGLVFSKPLTIKDDDIYYHGKPISQLLTSTQNTLLYKLIQKNNCCTNYDELGAVLWNTDDHFSVWAINKAMSRLKERLKELNISAVIENKKGAGYYLINS